MIRPCPTEITLSYEKQSKKLQMRDAETQSRSTKLNQTKTDNSVLTWHTASCRWLCQGPRQVRSLTSHFSSELIKYSWPSNDREIKGAESAHSRKSSSNFRRPQNWTANNLLLTRSLTGNIDGRLTHILYIRYIIDCMITVKWARGKKTLPRKS